MKNLAMEMAIEFKKFMELEEASAKAGELQKAEYYMNKKWETSRYADKEKVRPEFDVALKELGVY